MKENKQKFWFFDPEEHGGADNMVFYCLSILAGVITIIIMILN